MTDLVERLRERIIDIENEAAAEIERLRADRGGMTDAEDLLLEIANSMSKPFIDPAEHANWCIDVTKDYFRKKGGA